MSLNTGGLFWLFSGAILAFIVVTVIEGLVFHRFYRLPMQESLAYSVVVNLVSTLVSGPLVCGWIIYITPPRYAILLLLLTFPLNVVIEMALMRARLKPRKAVREVLGVSVLANLASYAPLALLVVLLSQRAVQ